MRVDNFVDAHGQRSRLEGVIGGVELPGVIDDAPVLTSNDGAPWRDK